MGLYARLHPLKSCTKRVSFLHFTPFFGSLPPLTRYAWARVLSLQFFKIVPPLCPSTCPPTSYFSSILPLGTGTRTFPDPPPSNAIRTPFKRGRNIKPTDALNAHTQRIYPHINKKGHTRKRAALCALIFRSTDVNEFTPNVKQT